MSSLILNRRILACVAVSIFLLSTLVVPAAHATVECTTIESGGFEGYTAAFVNPTSLPLVVDATGCDIGIYFNTAGSVNGVEVFGANRYGIVNYGAAVDIRGSNIHDNPYGIWFSYGTGTIDQNTVSRYQDAGIYVTGSTSVATVTNNVVIGLGPTESIVQIGIWISWQVVGYLKGNDVSGNWYTGTGGVSSGILGGRPRDAVRWFGATSLIAENNNVHDNQVSILFYGDGYYNLCTTTQLTRNNIHHSEVGIAIMCGGWLPPADPLTIDDNNIHHNAEPLEWDMWWPEDRICTWVESGYVGDAWIGLNHLHQNGWDEPPYCPLQ